MRVATREVVEVDAELRRRVGRAWREIRRGASAIKVRDLFYGSDDGPLDLALADALILIAQQGPMRMGELAEAMHITPASTTRAVNCLAEKQLVERVKDDDDQRSIQVQVTAKGRARYEEISGKIQRGMNLMLSEFTAEEQVQLAEYLERFVAAVDTLAESADGK